MMNPRITILTLATELLYVLVVSLFQLFQSSALLTVWELTTMASSIIVYQFMIRMANKEHKTYPLIRLFLMGMIAFTFLAHTLSLAIVRPLIAKGVVVPTYYQIGHWFSFQMLMDYLGWGLCLGIAMILLHLWGKELKKSTSMALLICGSLCLIGFVGGLFHPYLWLVAPCGYGLGLTILCIMLLYNKFKKDIGIQKNADKIG